MAPPAGPLGVYGPVDDSDEFDFTQNLPLTIEGPTSQSYSGFKNGK